MLVNPENDGNLQSQITSLQQQVIGLQSSLNAAGTNATVTYDGNSSLAQIYAEVKDSVVVVQGYTVQYDFFGRAFYSGVQGSGFVYNYNGKMIVVTNNHVISGTVNDTVTFANGDSYPATVLGSDPYADLAALATQAPSVEYKPLQIASSSSLSVGDPLIAVGGPYGLAGSMTTGIVSALGRTITSDTSTSYPIADVIQTSTPINPGNSGGPLLNYEGQVVGITTAIVSNSQGLGFAIPSATILREIGSLATSGSYSQHPWLGASGTDMTLDIANALKVNATYGWLVTGVTSGGPADKAGIQGGSKQITVAGNAAHGRRRHHHRVQRSQNQKHRRHVDVLGREHAAQPDDNCDHNKERYNEGRFGNAGSSTQLDLNSPLQPILTCFLKGTCSSGRNF